MEDDFLITAADLQRKGFCIRKSRRWAIDNGIDFEAFLRNGILASELVSTGDGMAITAVNLIRGDRG